MSVRVVVMSRRPQAWRAATAARARWRAGLAPLTDLACGPSPDDGSGRGPSLVNKFGSQETLQSGEVVTVDDSYVRESILTPQLKIVAGYQPLMPTFQGMVNEESVMALIEYLKSKTATGQGSGQAAGSPVAAPAAAPVVPAQENR